MALGLARGDRWWNIDGRRNIFCHWILKFKERVHSDMKISDKRELHQNVVAFALFSQNVFLLFIKSILATNHHFQGPALLLLRT